MIAPRDSRRQYSGLQVAIGHYDRGLPPLGSPAWQQINSDRYILRENWPISDSDRDEHPVRACTHLWTPREMQAIF